MEFVGLESLTDASDWGAVRVRVCRMWDAMNTKTQKLIGLDIVVVDEEHTLMWMRVWSSMLSRFKNLLAVGCVYVITGYIVSRVTCEYRPVDNPFWMSFTRLTSVEKVTNLVPAIPKHGFQFVSHSTIKSHIVGRLTEVCGVETVSGGFRKRELKLISDNLVNFMVTLWGEDADRFVDQYKIDGATNPIVVFSSMNVKQYLGVLNLKKTSATHIYVNLEHEYVASLAERFTKKFPTANLLVHPSPPLMSAEEEMSENRMTISQVLSAGWAHEKRGYKMTFVGSIAAVSTECGWYYFGCKACKRGVSPVDGSYTCSSCDTKSNDRLILYRVQFDVRDDTGVLSCVIWSNLAERMIGSSSMELFNNETFPPEVLALRGKKYIFKIRLTDYNLKYDSDVFTVREVFSPDVKLEDKYFTPTSDYEEIGQQPDVSEKVESSKKRDRLGVDVEPFEVTSLAPKRRKYICDDSDDDTE